MPESSTTDPPAAPPRSDRGAWVNVGVAALLMVATFPGRTHGLSLLTVPLLDDFHISQVRFGHINMWASLIGAAFCLPCGWLIDRHGIRPVLAGVVIGLGAAVVGMTSVESPAALAVMITLTRGFGQSALSVVSLAVVARTVFRRREMAMGVFAVLVGLGFAAVVGVVQAAEARPQIGWRTIWAAIGVALLLAVLPLAWVMLSEPDAAPDPAAPPDGGGLTLAAALRTPAFWAVTLTCSLFLFVSSGTTLFYQLILGEFGFGRGEFETMLVVAFGLGTVFNLVCGWLGQWWSMTRLLGVGSLALAASLAFLPTTRAMSQLYVYAAAAAFAGGAVTVVFFGVWRPLFGPAHVGAIQGAAQMVTVLAAAVSQWAFPAGREWAGSYAPVLYTLAGLAAVLGMWVWVVPPPRHRLEVPSAESNV